MLRQYIPKSVRKWVKKKVHQYDNPPQMPKNDEIDEIKKNFDIYLSSTRNPDSFVVYKQNASERCELDLPIPPKDLWLGYGKNKEEYLWGKEQVDNMIKIAENSGFDFSNGKKILDFGCGAGRMIRWLKPFAEKCEIWGTDISADHINWANLYLKPPFNFAITTTIPHLPFEDKYFDFIYSGSVFTHIDDMANAWLLELRRILKPDGRLYITIQDKHSIEQLETVPVYQQLWLAKYMKKIVPEDKSFKIFIGDKGIHSQVFYDIDFFCQSVKTIFDVISITKNAYGFQTGILMKRK